ncbi:MAG: hypothetical protein J7493_00420 [Porphyrobacter sp.]|nr:hypothetical protein [Porphyrobacter sp.]
MRTTHYLVTFAALGSLAACSGDETNLACEAPRPPLRSTANAGEAPELTPVVRFRVTSQGTVTRGSESFDGSQLQEVLADADKFIPNPVYVFEVDEAVPCAKLAAVRAVLGDASLCKSGNCFEGELPAHWRAMPDT